MPHLFDSDELGRESIRLNYGDPSHYKWVGLNHSELSYHTWVELVGTGDLHSLILPL